ncbi:MAG: hypothetical protein H0T76_23455 [Nannocystis sp.]|nr:hypothetical protein [Nannocystis sp.]MBA3549443.1 hypothetical protein [Nannocystis sp.]
MALLLACGTDGEHDTNNATSLPGITSAASTPGPTTGTSDAGPGSSGAGPGSSGAATTDVSGSTGPGGTSGPGDPSDTLPVTDSGPATDDTGVGTTNFDPPPAGDYAATYIPGEQNRISVRKANLADDWCATITFVAPQEMGPLEYDITLPATWRVQSALIHQGAADCLSFVGFPGEPIMAISGNGTASWAGACPTALDVDLTVAFPPEQPWAPPEVLLQSKAVAVSGC